MKFVTTSLIGALALVIFFQVSPSWNPYRNWRNRRIAAEIIEAYNERAEVGLLPKPGKGEGCLLIGARCIYSEPSEVDVLNDVGDRFCFIASKKDGVTWPVKLFHSSTN